MLIEEINEQECHEALARANSGRLGCSLNDQPYVIPVYFVYDEGYAYFLGTEGRKIEWMRRNPKVCLQVDEIASETEWTSVIALGTYQELPEPQYSSERAHARKLLERRPQWWRTAFAEREAKTDKELIDPLFFRIQISSVTGLRSKS
jgi:uncharacterized protein